MKILMGAGLEAEAGTQHGWVSNDVNPFPGVTLIGPCWDLDVPNGTVDEILAKGMLEHLTYHDVERAFIEWHRVLRVGGYVTVEAPDVEQYILEYIKMRTDLTSHAEGRDGGAEGEPTDFAVCTGIDRWLRRALWGWQRWPSDEHRSGWTEPLLQFYLTRQFPKVEIRHMAISFDEDVPEARVRHLWARGWKW